MKHGKFVLENKQGQVVRTFRWDQTSMKLIYRHDNRRIEAHASTRELEKDDISFELLADVKREQVKKSPVAIANVGRLTWNEELEHLAPNVALQEENSQDSLVIFKWTALSYVAVVGVIVLIGHFLKPAPVQEQVVKILDVKKIEDLPQPKEKQITVAASDTKPVPPPKNQPQAKVAKETKKARTQITKSNTKQKASRTAKQGFAGPESGDPNNAGVLGILGGESRKGTGRGGFNPANAKSSGGYGAGKGGGGYGGPGAGGVARGVFGRGMIAANPGSGSSAPGAGGYGRAGRGGGGRTGYGSLSMVGASNAYFSPIEEEATITGGLDKDAIAEVIQRNMGQIVYCYEQGLQVKPNLAGRVSVKFVINGGGRVASAGIANSSLHNGSVEGCIVGKLKSWKFPKPVGGVNVSVQYPFALRRVSSR